MFHNVDSARTQHYKLKAFARWVVKPGMEKIMRPISRIEREKEKAMLAEMPVWIHNALVLMGWKFHWD